MFCEKKSTFDKCRVSYFPWCELLRLFYLRLNNIIRLAMTKYWLLQEIFNRNIRLALVIAMKDIGVDVAKVITGNCHHLI